MPPNFTFPPPPPPPPQVTFDSNVSSRGSHHREGRWQSRGRGRGTGPRPYRTHGSRPRIDWDRPGQGSSGSSRQGNRVSIGHTVHHGSQKRSHEQAFTPKQQHVPFLKAPPAVPSFGPPLPVIPVSAAKSVSVPAPKSKKDRTFNQLGLTPRKEEHESSEEDDDEDEELRLGAASRSLGRDALQFEHKGQLMTLRTPADIQAWITERKKRYPTKAKIAEAITARKKYEEKNGPGNGPGISRAKQRSEFQRRPNQVKHPEHKFARTGETKQRKTQGNAGIDPASSIQKYRHQRTRDNNPGKTDQDDTDSLLESSSDSEFTSSSGNSDTTESSDGPPIEQSAKMPTAALPVASIPSPHSQRSDHPCPHSRKSGRCRMKNCPHKHTNTQHNVPPDPGAKDTRKQDTHRVLLYDRLLAKQHDQEDQEILRYIIAMGERGLLDGKN